MAVQMELNRIIISDLDEPQHIMLREVDGGRSFYIVIGSREAHAIDDRLKGKVASRPLTHDLLGNVIEALGGRLAGIEIYNLQDGTYYAWLHIHRDGQKLKIDCRPSDAIALGVAGDVPIYVAEHVLDESTRK